jgi:hypothetical protein
MFYLKNDTLKYDGVRQYYGRIKFFYTFYKRKRIFSIIYIREYGFNNLIFIHTKFARRSATHNNVYYYAFQFHKQI